jgi:hypothetical protein
MLMPETWSKKLLRLNLCDFSGYKWRSLGLVGFSNWLTSPQANQYFIHPSAKLSCIPCLSAIRCDSVLLSLGTQRHCESPMMNSNTHEDSTFLLQSHELNDTWGSNKIMFVFDPHTHWVQDCPISTEACWSHVHAVTMGYLWIPNHCYWNVGNHVSQSSESI